MYSVSTKKYNDILRRCYEKKTPLYVYGAPGIGKSEIPRQVFPEVAKEMKRKFLDWSDLTLDQKHDAIKNAGKYWIFCDQRVGMMDSTSLAGIPNMINTEMLENIPMSWIVYFTQEDAAGCIFFDELNLAAPTVAGQAYQIINDRTIVDRRLADDVYVFGAGNRAGLDQAYVHEMPLPLKDRFCEFEIEPDVQSWTEDYAAKHVNGHLVSFVNWKNSYLYRVDENKTVKASTPRGISRASKLIAGLDITSNETHMYISMSVGEAFATEFQAYIKHYKALSWDVILKDPKSVSNMTVDKLWAIVGGIIERYNTLSTKSIAKSAEVFEQYMDVVSAMPPDFGMVAIRMMKDSDGAKFRNYFSGYSKIAEMADSIGKYIL
jgi:MoxR-like ATPase